MAAAAAAAAATVSAAVSAARWRGVRTCASQATASPLLARLMGEPERRVKGTMEEASSTPSCDDAFWEPLAAALRPSSPAKAHLVLEWKLEKLLKDGTHHCEPFSRIIHFCGKTRNTALAMKVFESMEAQDIRPNTGVFNALIAAFLSAGDLVTALTLFEAMEGHEDCNPNLATYDAFISAFSRLGSGHAMMSWYLAAKKAGFTPSILPFESLITGFVRLNRLDDAAELFEEMISMEMKPNPAILEAKLEMLCRRKDLGKVKDYLKFISDGGWELNEAIGEKLSKLYLDEGLIDEMGQLLCLARTDLHSRALARLHCGIIRFYASADRLEDMECAICRMLEGGMMFLCQDDVQAVICSYLRGKEFVRLDSFLDRIRDSYKLTKSTYDILVAGYKRFELHDRLDLTIRDMKAAGFA